jgi:autotransporter-associated beta strand protein
VDPANATDTVTVASNITDSKGPGGGAFLLKKSGAGSLQFSGTNTYTGPTTVAKGTLSLANSRSLGDKTDIYVSDGATLDLNFRGEMRIRKLYLDGKLQPAGTYSAANAPKYIKGTGVLKNQ